MIRTLLLAALLWSTTAFAQRPRVLLVFDTSGSMSFDVASGQSTGGDNSPAYPGDGRQSRLFVAKEVVRGLVQTTPEVAFGLMRYPQIEGAGINDGTGRGAFTSYQGLAENPLNYEGFCNGTVRDPERPFALLEAFAPNNNAAILRWMDGAEAFPADKELRAEGPTPIAESLRLARTYYEETLAVDPVLRCRQNYVVLLTDGAESCITPENTQQEVLLNRTLALREMQINGVQKSVRVFVVAFAVQPARRALLDAVARAGGTAINAAGDIDLINGRAHTASDQAGLQMALDRVLAEAIPDELCNGIDDDCDGDIDEGVANACGLCGPLPREVCNDIDDDCDGTADEGTRNECGGCGDTDGEICNGADEDCDGVIDEGVANACGGCGEVGEETCNGEDDDCDGTTDEGVTRVCGVAMGACQAGVERCVDGAFGACDGVAPVEETCNGADDDCDGSTDEITRPCGAAVDIGEIGVCRAGTQVCAAMACMDDPRLCDDEGWSVGCDGVEPTAEICDELDNDCDGTFDEGLFNACGDCGPPLPDRCNGVDDNCDGRIDEAADCPVDTVCYFGECVEPCDASNECSGDFTCVQAFPGRDGRVCHTDPCAGGICAPGQVCDSELQRCVDPCAGVACGPNEGCDLGQCVPATCRHRGCPDGQRCADDACVGDLCAGIECEGRQFCRDGRCVDACVQRACGADLHCEDGQCVDDECGGRCLRGQLCDGLDGVCIEDPCARVRCAVGLGCVDGECRGDAPCVGIVCGPGLHCVDGGCTDDTPGVPPELSRGAAIPPDAAVDTDAIADDGGVEDSGLVAIPDFATRDAEGGKTSPGEGCSCDTTSGTAPWWALLLLGWRRRR